jgi:formylglycine-generating enzyme required for sulfatase activity
MLTADLRSLIPCAAFALGVATACSSRSGDGGAAPSSTAAAAASATAAVAAPAPAPAAGSVAAAASAAATPAAEGPVIRVPAGQLMAGTACGDHPRVPAEELAGETIELGAFTIDTYPYPNDPAQPPKTGVSQDEAKQLCEVRGRRLCTELEWERACKGPSNTRYEYGDRFDVKACPTGIGAIPSYAAFERCAGGFGARAMHGFVFEWTASPWKRGKEEGKTVLRGGYGNAPYGHMRCSAVKAADPAEKAASVGFRCCGGPVNAREVEIPAPEEAPPALAEETTIDDALMGRLKRALVNGQLKDADGVTSTFAKVWRWRPAANEELLLARYESRREGGAAFVQPFVIRLCDRTVQLIGRLRGPVDSMEAPVVREDAPGIVTLAVQSGDSTGEVRLVYQFAQVLTGQPAWLQVGATPGAPGSSSAPAP